PNFISWVLVYAIATCIFSTDGFISSIMVSMGIWDQGVNMLMGESHTWLKMLAWGLWKGIGWSAIVYVSSISGIDQQLYEAATVDGAGRFARMWHITVPSLMPTFFVLLLMSVGNILSNGMDQYLVFENATNSNAIMVLDLYVYKLGIGQGQIPLSTVIGMTKSLVSVALLFTANGLSRKLRGESIM
ncbi:MAG: ABC transporter permease subunit, partial [Aristaeellaceae bacterium]